MPNTGIRGRASEEARLVKEKAKKEDRRPEFLLQLPKSSQDEVELPQPSHNFEGRMGGGGSSSSSLTSSAELRLVVEEEDAAAEDAAEVVLVGGCLDVGGEEEVVEAEEGEESSVQVRN